MTPEDPGRVWRGGLHLTTLWMIAVVQPVFDVLGRNPEFLVAHRAGAGELLRLIVLLCVGPPLCGMVLVRGAGHIGPRVRRAVLAAMIGLMVAVLVLHIARDVQVWPSGLTVLAAVVGGALGAAAYVRFAPVRLFVTWLSPACIVVPAVLLLQPPIVRLLTSWDGQLFQPRFAGTPRSFSSCSTSFRCRRCSARTALSMSVSVAVFTRRPILR